MHFGVCADPRFAPALAGAGFDFIELNVQQHLMPLADDATFEPEMARIKSASLPTIAANSFVPASLKIVGTNVHGDALEGYAETAFARAQALGIRSIVFGSGGARQIPDGFDRDEAWEQLLSFGRMIGPRAQAHDVTVVVEPLNVTRGECNVLTTVGESARYVKQVNHPNVRLLADAYHWGLDNDSFGELVASGPLLRHVHIATVEHRLPPGFEDCDFTGFFHALWLGGYDGPVSIESRWDDVAAQAAAAFAGLMGAVHAAGL
jgi:sugar phosphate isomerase/epimerase